METTHHADALLVKIREAKEAQDLTNEDIAELTGMNETTVSRVISGSGKRPSFDTLVTMAAALHISVDKILYALLPDAEITPKVETVAENFAHLIKVKDDLINEKEAQITDKDDIIDKMHADLVTNRSQRRKLATVLFVQSVVIAALLTALALYVCFDMIHGHFIH